MNAQEIGTLVIVVAAAGFLGWRTLSRRRAKTCCGETECPAAKEALKRIPDAK